MGLRSILTRRGRTPAHGSRSQGFDELLGWWQSLKAGGVELMPTLSLGEKQEHPAATFAGYAQSAYRENGVVFACILTRMLLFSEARFQFRQRRGGRPGDLFGTADLAPLEQPWPNGTTGDLLSRMLQDADLAGNFFGARRAGGIRRLVPSWVTIVMGSNTQPNEPGGALDAEVIGYIYEPGGPGSGADPETLVREEVCHFAPIPDPLARFRGMSWLTPVIREIMGDKAATQHKLRYFENGATRNIAVSVDKDVGPEKFNEFVRLYREEHADMADAYRHIFLGGGADIEVIGDNLHDVDFHEVQGGGETRIAAAAGVPPVIVGLSEGLDAATYSNYAQARRRFADGTMRPLWRNAAGSLAQVIAVPAGAELWYDDRDIPFLQEDEKDAAAIVQMQADTINRLVREGFTPESATDAVVSGDLKRLVHTGLVSVQLQPPGTVNKQPAVTAQNGRAALPIGAGD